MVGLSAASFVSVLGLGIVGCGFVSGLEAERTVWAMSSMVLGAVLFLGGLGVMAWKVKYGPHTDPKQRSMRLKTGLWLCLWVLGAFALSFLMIPLYYLLNGDGGHVHGAAASSTEDSGAVLGIHETVKVYMTADLNNESAPVRLVLKPKTLVLKPGEHKEVELVLINPLPHAVFYRLKSKLVPAIAASYVHYALDERVEIPAQGQKVLKLPLHVAQGLPAMARSMAITHFVLSERSKSAWQKMQEAWHVF